LHRIDIIGGKKNESTDTVLRHFLIIYRNSNVQESETDFCSFKGTLAKESDQIGKRFSEIFCLHLPHFKEEFYTQTAHVNMKSLLISGSKTNVYEKFLKRQFID